MYAYDSIKTWNYNWKVIQKRERRNNNKRKLKYQIREEFSLGMSEWRERIIN